MLDATWRSRRAAWRGCSSSRTLTCPAKGRVAEESFEAWQLQVSGNAPRRHPVRLPRSAAAPLAARRGELRRASPPPTPTRRGPTSSGSATRPRTLACRSLIRMRYYFSILPTNETAWVDPRNFDARARPDELVADGEPIALFLDCSKTEDATALVAAGSATATCSHSTAGIARTATAARVGWRRATRSTPRSAPRSSTYDVQWFGVIRRRHGRRARGPVLGAAGRRVAPRLPRQCARLGDPGRQRRPLGALRHAPSSTGRPRPAPGVHRGRASRPRRRSTTSCTRSPRTATAMLRLHVHNARRRPNQYGVSRSASSRATREARRLRCRRWSALASAGGWCSTAARAAGSASRPGRVA